MHNIYIIISNANVYIQENNGIKYFTLLHAVENRETLEMHGKK